MNDNYSENEKKLYLAMLAEQCERYKDMIEILENLINIKKEEMNLDEKNLISIAYKNYISEIRSAISIIITYEKEEISKENSPYLEYIKEYKENVIKELEIECVKICNSIQNIIMPKLETKEKKVFFGKLKGDYYRYIAENTEGEIKQKYSDLSLKTYNETLIEANNLNHLLQLNFHYMFLMIILNISFLFLLLYFLLYIYNNLLSFSQKKL